MKYFIGMAVTLLLSTPVLAAGELEINQSPLTLVLSDQNQARVSSCADFIALRKAGETVDALPGLSDPDGRAAEAALFSCWLQAYTIDHTLFPSAGRNQPWLRWFSTFLPVRRLSSAMTKSRTSPKTMWGKPSPTIPRT